jgi:hypothetical protein
MLDCAPLLTAADRLADRYRSLPQSRLHGAVAEDGLELARRLAAEAQSVESPGTPARLMPDEGIFAVGDQIAVAAHDLTTALRQCPRGPESAAVLTAAVARVAETARRCGL